MYRFLILLIILSISSLYSLKADILSSPIQLGATINNNRVNFAIYAPNKKYISVVGDFNNWDKNAHPLTKNKEGIWQTSIYVNPGTYRYKFWIDGKWIGDPYAKDIEWDGFGANAILKINAEKHKWNDSAFKAPPLNELIIYEIHVGDFSKEGTFNGVTKKIPYLKELGINAIYLMPIMEFPGDISWGYNPAYFFAPESTYGTPEDLKRLIDTAHQNNIAVILDMVLNHCAHESPFNQLYPYNENPYFSTDGNPWGFPDFNHWSAPTKRFVRDLLKYWIKEYHIDGFRFDYTRGIGYDGYNGLSYITYIARNINPNIYLIAEHLPQDPHLVITTNMDSEWHDTFHDQMKANLREGIFEGSNYYGDLNKTEKALNFAYDGFTDNAQCINYTECHDEERVIYEALTNPKIDFPLAIQKSKLGAITLFTAAGVPMLYHGQEFGMDTKRTIDQNKLKWELLNTDTGKSLYNFYKRLVYFRRKHNALKLNYFETMAKYHNKMVIIFKRYDLNGDVIVVALNFSNYNQYVDIPFPYNGKWYEYIYNYSINVSGNILKSHKIPASSGKIFYLKK